MDSVSKPDRQLTGITYTIFCAYMFQVCWNSFNRQSCTGHGLEQIWTLSQSQTDGRTDRQLTGISLAIVS